MLSFAILLLFFLNPFESVSGAGNHPACGTGRPAIPPSLLKSVKLGVVGGDEAVPHEFPWQVLIISNLNINGNNVTKYCGGSILNEKWILTAAQCVADERITQQSILAGMHIWKHNDVQVREEGTQEVLATWWNPHPLYREAKNSNGDKDYDVGVIKLVQPLNPFPTKNIAPICLPEQTDDLDRFERKKCFVSGWGTTGNRGDGQMSDVLMKDTDTVWNHNDCWRRDAGTITERMLCFGGTGMGRKAGICSGDNGGPLVCLGDEIFPPPYTRKWYQAGVNSFVIGYCSNADWPTIHTRVSIVSKWIWEQVEMHGRT